MFIERNLRPANGVPNDGTQSTVQRAHSLRHAVALLEEQDYDVVLLDMGLPDGEGPSNIQCIAAASTAPIVVLTSSSDEATAIEAVRFGAQDYLLKSEFSYRSLSNSMRFAAERQRRSLAADRERQQENAIKDQLLSHVSHELRTPLTAVLQFVSILRDGIAGELNSQQSEYLGIILRNVEQLKRMISTLMDATRATTGKLSYEPRRVRVQDVIRDAVDSVAAVAATKQIELVIDRASPSCEVIADAQRIVQVLRNLLENAIKFTPEGNAVTVQVACSDHKPHEATVSVRDTGRGISPEDIEQIFDRMYQVGDQRDVCRKGLGLGLHIAKEIVALHGGEIHVESEVGHGSCFSFPLKRYSLEHFVRQVALVDTQLQESLSLLAVSLRAEQGVARAKGVECIVPLIKQAVEGCMHGNCDVVLPHRSEAHKVTLLALARTGDVGIEAITGRVQAELDRLSEPKQWGFSVTMTSHHFPIDAAANAEQTIASLVDTVQRKIQTIEESNA